jgi:hypothetical protein
MQNRESQEPGASELLLPHITFLFAPRGGSTILDVKVYMCFMLNYVFKCALRVAYAQLCGAGQLYGFAALEMIFLFKFLSPSFT